MEALLYSVPPTLQQATANPCLLRRFLDSHRQVWVNLLWSHCSFLLGPGVHKVLCGPSQSLFTQSCVSSAGSVVGLMVTSSKMAYCTQSLCPTAVHCWPVLPQETLKHSSGSVSGSWCAQFRPSYHLAGLLLCPWMWGIFLVGSNILLLTPVRA